MNGKRTTTPGPLSLNPAAANQAVQDLPDKPTHRTGFPEPLSPDRNTTLRHPSADTSPNACIEAADVPLSRTHSRVSSKHSFRFGHSRQKSYRADGPIDMSVVYAANGRTSNDSIDGVLEAVSSVDTKANGEVLAGDAGQGHIVGLDGADLRTSSEASFDKDVGVKEVLTPSKKGSVLKKLRLGK